MSEMYGIIDSMNNINNYIDEFSLFISSISSEERYIRGYNLLKINNIDISKKIIFFYEEVLSASILEPHDEAFFKDSYDLSSTDVKLDVELYNEFEGMISFREYLDNNRTDFEGTNIAIDISVMIKPYFFLLVKHLLSFSFNKICFIYTEPDIYQNFTRGTMKAKDISGYSGIKDLSKRDALILILGFEGYRTIAIYNQVNPELTIPINGFPSYKPEFKDISILTNKELLSEKDIFTNLKYAPANDPFMTFDVLNEVYSNYSNSHNISIAPLGTKPMALGSCFFASEHDECRVIYPYPLEYVPKSSYGYNNTWVYTINSK